MSLLKKITKKNQVFLFISAVGLTAALMIVSFPGGASARLVTGIYSEATIWPDEGESKKPAVYKSAEEAVNALVEALGSNDNKKLLDVFGSEGKTLISSGDDVEDKAARERFLQSYRDKNRIVNISEKKAVLEIGKDDWLFPIPIVKASGGKWRFDVKEGKEEILNRRIGRNELSAIQVCLAYVDAQREYASKDRGGDGVREYAQKFLSETGRKDGLYWEAGEGGEQSPMGPLMAEAGKEGYKKLSDGGKTPYHGYYYRILKAQGKNAARGAHNYVVDGRMIGGFAMVAYPAEYGASGIKSFIVNQDGVVYEKDLGPKTAAAAAKISKFDPDSGWRKVPPRHVQALGAKKGEPAAAGK